MSYRVFWSPEAERMFKQLHAATSDPMTLVKASRNIDTQLRADPYEFGESRQANVRIGFERPLAVQFEVLDDVRTVIVFDVWQTGRLPE
jgi:hypothetical protein